MGFAFEFYIQPIWLNEIILCMERLFDMVDFMYAQRDYLPLEPLEFPVHKRDTYTSRYSPKIDQNW